MSDLADLQEKGLDGDQESIKKLANMYRTGDGVPVDLKEAERWESLIEKNQTEKKVDQKAQEAGKIYLMLWNTNSHRMLAENIEHTDDPRAMCDAAYQYAQLGQPGKAIEYWEKEQEILKPYVAEYDPNEQNPLTLMWYEGLNAEMVRSFWCMYCTEEDDKKKFAALLQANELSCSNQFPIIALRLATCYEKGIGTEKDNDKAIQLLQNVIDRSRWGKSSKIKEIGLNSIGLREDDAELFPIIMAVVMISRLDKVTAGINAQKFLINGKKYKNELMIDCARVLLHEIQMIDDSGEIPDETTVSHILNDKYSGEHFVSIDILRIIYDIFPKSDDPLLEKEAFDSSCSYIDNLPHDITEINIKTWRVMKDARSNIESRIETRIQQNAKKSAQENEKAKIVQDAQQSQKDNETEIELAEQQYKKEKELEKKRETTFFKCVIVIVIIFLLMHC